MTIFAIKDLVNKLDKIASLNRYDLVISTILDVFEKRASINPNLIVSASEIENIYQEVFGLNSSTKFKEYLPEAFETKVQAKKNDSSSFTRDASFNSERDLSLRSEVNEEDSIKKASLSQIQNVIESSVFNPQYHFNGYAKVSNYGGVASWKVSFPTKTGKVSVNIPVIIAEEAVFVPENFYYGKTAYKFNGEELNKFAKTHIAQERESITERPLISDLGGGKTLIKEDYITPAIEDGTISLSYSIPMDENLDKKIEGVQTNLYDAIEKAREMVKQKLSIDQNGNEVAKNFYVTLNVSYSGAVEFDNTSPQEFKGVVAFNVQNNIKKGSFVTVPVEVNGRIIKAESFYDSNSNIRPLNFTEVQTFLNKENVSPQDEEVDAFSNAFLAEASFSELTKEMKISAESGNIKRATACLKHISSKFGEDAFNEALGHYYTFIKDANTSKANSIKCQGCAFFETPNVKGSVHAEAYCKKLSTKVASVKRGFNSNECQKLSSAITYTDAIDEQIKQGLNSQITL
jgi:hypothetical protein